MPQRRAPARKWRTAHFVNLLENAIQHSAPGASIVINGEANDESTCCVRFADIGSGIASVDLPHVFERFYRSEWVGNRVLNPILRQLGIDKKLKAMGIKRCGNYAFRHMNATVMDEIGTPLKTRQHRLGHARIETTMTHYTHKVDADDRQAAEAIGVMLSPAVKTVVM